MLRHLCKSPDSRLAVAMRVDGRCVGVSAVFTILRFCFFSTLPYVFAVYLMSLRFLRLLAARCLDSYGFRGIYGLYGSLSLFDLYFYFTDAFVASCTFSNSSTSCSVSLRRSDPTRGLARGMGSTTCDNWDFGSLQR